MLYKTKKSRSAIPGYTLIPEGDHYKVRKISLTGERVKTDPAFKLTRLNNEAFKKAASLGSTLRFYLIRGTGIKNKTAPLTAALIKALTANNAPMHERSFTAADFTTMDNFNLNEEAPWNDYANLNIDTLYTPIYKRVTVFLPGFQPSQAFKAPEGITHARLITRVLFINLEEELRSSHEEKTTILPLKDVKVRAQTIVAKAEEKDVGIWVVAMSIEWYLPAKKNGQLTVSKTRGPLIIVKMGSV
jgi:hypothetical protein